MSRRLHAGQPERRYQIAYRDSDGRRRIETVDDTLEEAKAARAEIVWPRCVCLVPSTKTTLETTQIQPFRTEVPQGRPRRSGRPAAGDHYHQPLDQTPKGAGRRVREWRRDEYEDAGGRD